MRRIFILIALIIPAHLFAQFTYVLDNSIPATVDKVKLPMAWAGGLNAAQYNTMDLDGDGKDDLVLFDRMGNKIITFIRLENTWQYAPDYEKIFPADIQNWFLLRDYNRDGRKDIFTGDIFGIKVYTNTSTGDSFSWEKYMFFNGVGGVKSGALLTKGTSPAKNNLQLQYDDLPSFMDADGDGDLDIFTMTYPNGNTIEYHRNLSQERYGTYDSLDYERQTRTWGSVMECACGTFAFDGEACNTGGRVEHAGGKSLLALDANGDAKLDIILSEANCTNLSLLPNTGNVAAPVISTSANFPASMPVNFLNYPAAYFEDVDFDGVKDLIATPNIYSKTYLNSDLKRSNWFYRNTGTDSNPNFILSQREFLQQGMIDLGDNSVPAFFDYDSDGDLDLFVSTSTSDLTVATVKLFENTGTGALAQFELKDNDYLDFSSRAFYNLKIQFADLNEDGKIDLFFTATQIFSAQTIMGFIPNRVFNGLSLSMLDSQPVTLPSYTFGQNENACVTDVDGDGKSDLLIGRSNGALTFWKNSGNLNFSLEQEAYLGLEASVYRQNLTCTAADLDSDGSMDLIIGDNSGQLKIVNNYREANTAETAAVNLVWNSRTESYEARNLGGQIWPTVANIFATRKPSIVVGNTLGGLTILRHDNEGEFPESPTIDVYPVPLTREKMLNVRTDRPMSMQIFSVTGQTLSEPVNVLANQPFTQDVSRFKSGVYILRFTAENKSFVRRFVVY